MFSGTIELVDGHPAGGDHNCLALTTAGAPRSSYHDFPHRDLKFAWHDGTRWYSQTVDSTGDVGWSIALAVDGADHAHVAYSDRAGFDVKYVYHDGTTWHVTG